MKLLVVGIELALGPALDSLSCITDVGLVVRASTIAELPDPVGNKTDEVLLSRRSAAVPSDGANIDKGSNVAVTVTVPVG